MSRSAIWLSSISRPCLLGFVILKIGEMEIKQENYYGNAGRGWIGNKVGIRYL
jgi:hypothetical protein